MSNRLSRRATALATAVTALLLLAGCAIPLPTIEADAAPEGPQPALDETRVQRVLDAVAEAVAAGDAEHDTDLFGTRVNGPAIQTRDAEYRLADATADSDDPTGLQPLTTEPQIIAVGNSDTWPKRVFVFTTIGEGMNTPLLLGLEQDTPREDYHLFAWVRLLPEVTTPAMAVPAEGSPQPAPDASGLVLSPHDAVAAYADLLEKGDDSDYADTFDDDVFRSYVQKDRAAIKESVEDAGEYSEDVGVRKFDPVSLETADGGAIVFGALRSDHIWERTIDQSEMTVGGQIALLAGSDTLDVDTSVTARYYITIALYVPPESSDSTIQVLGAERVLDAVETE